MVIDMVGGSSTVRVSSTSWYPSYKWGNTWSSAPPSLRTSQFLLFMRRRWLRRASSRLALVALASAAALISRAS